MPYKTRPIDRDSGRVVQDAWLIVIASEDTHAVEKYFEAFQSTRVRVRVLKSVDGRSAPLNIVDRLDEYRAEYEIGGNDQLWYCGDTDHWSAPGHIKNLRQALRRCQQCNYYIAVSNPCFEFWVLLHYAELTSTNLQGSGVCNQVESELKRHSGGYSKDNGTSTPPTEQQILDAVRRAKAIPESHKLIPRSFGTAVYKIVEELIARGALPQSMRPNS